MDIVEMETWNFFFFFSADLLHSIFLFYWMTMKMGMIVDDAEEFPCGDGLRDRAAVIHASYHNYPWFLKARDRTGTCCAS